MAGVADTKLKKAGPWPQGVNNLAPEGMLPTDEFGIKFLALREADNVDITKEGRVMRRKGWTGVQPMVLAHSLWSGPGMDFGLMVDEGMLYSVAPNGTINALNVQVGNQPLSYDVFNDRVFYTSPQACGMISLGLQHNAWNPECPSGQPAVAPYAGLSLSAGQYQVAVTFTDVLGRESGTGRATAIQLAEGAGIQLSAIPVPTDTALTPIVNIYLSDPNGTVLHRHTSLPAGTLSFLIGTFAQSGVVLETQMLQPMPAGQIVRRHNGRQWVADGRNLRWSPVMRYGLTNPAQDVIRFDAKIDLLEPVGSGESSAGLYVSAGDRTYWLGGVDPSKFNKKLASSSGAIPRSQVYVPGNYAGTDTTDDVTMWVSKGGQFCVGQEGGKIAPLKQGQALVDDAVSAASLFMERNGMGQVVTTMKGPRPQGGAVSDRAVAHVLHNPG